MRQITIIGVGLIGGSLARALRDAAFCANFIGCSRDSDHLQRAVDLGVIDRFSTHLPEAVAEADLVVLAVPMQAVPAILAELKSSLPANAVVTDVGSTKGSVLAALHEQFGEVPSWFVPGHPIAGTERSGVEASFGQLFQGRRVILTPQSDVSPQALDLVRSMWQATGAEVIEMEVNHHDEVLAATSHLPHLLAYALVDTLARMDESDEIFRYAAGGFRDFTRIAASDPVMWRDIVLTNRSHVVAMVEQFQTALAELKEQIESGEEAGIDAVFGRAQAARERFAQRDRKQFEK